jgi:type IV secretory pathway TrbD component
MTTAAVGSDSTRGGFFSFPDPVNETAVRLTAAGVALLALLAVSTRRPELLVAIAYGFTARVMAGPRLSPLALLSSRVVAPRLTKQPRLVAGPPKRFAQGLGAIASLTAVGCYYLAGWHTAAFGLALLMVVLATLESAWRICVGCILHAWLARRGVVRSAECVDCGDISLRLGTLR